MFAGRSVLITGGTGSFGRKFAERLLKSEPAIERIIIFSRDELKQYEMANTPFIAQNMDKFRFFIGDVRDLSRLSRAFEDVDYVVHAAALKQVPAAEYNPMECIKTNVIGAQNVIDAALSSGVSKVIALSTDKAAAPINLYGATKLCSDKLFTTANNIKGKRDILFSVVRYGNVMGSRGSVIPFFLEKRKEKTLPITDPEMTRFNITLDEGVDLVFYAFKNAWGGEIFVPKIPSYRITELANAIGPDCEIKVTGIRPGEKIHEEMITASDSMNTLDCGKYYTILPFSRNWELHDYMERFKAKAVPVGFQYNSGTNSEWLNVQQLRQLIVKNVDPDFSLNI